MYSLIQQQLDDIESILDQEILILAVHCVFLIDMAGNVIANLDDGKFDRDIYSLAVLSAGNFGAISQLAEIIEEKENIHSNRVSDHFLLVTIFGMDVSLRFLRLRTGEATEKINQIVDPGW